MVCIFLYCTPVLAGGGLVKVSNVKALCEKADLIYAFKAEADGRNPIKVTIFKQYQEGTPLAYANLTNEVWTINVNGRQLWYEGIIYGGCLVPMWAWQREAKFRIVVKPSTGEKATSKTWLKPFGMFYPDNPSKCVPPPGYLPENKNEWKKYCFDCLKPIFAWPPWIYKYSN